MELLAGHGAVALVADRGVGEGEEGDCVAVNAEVMFLGAEHVVTGCLQGGSNVKPNSSFSVIGFMLRLTVLKRCCHIFN